MKLTRDRIDRFHETGYLMLPGLFSAEEAGVLRKGAGEVYAMDRQEVVREKDGVSPAPPSRPIATTRRSAASGAIRG